MSKYLGHTGGLIGPVTMEKPMKNFLDTDAEFLIRKHKYQQHLSLLPIIPCEGWLPEVGKAYTKGVDFYLQHTTPPHKVVAVRITQGQPVHLPAANNSGDGKEFLSYVKKSRYEFTSFISSFEWRTDLRTAIDSLLICFDQMADRLQSPAYPAEFVEWCGEYATYEGDGYWSIKPADEYYFTSELFAGPYTEWKQSQSK